MEPTAQQVAFAQLAAEIETQALVLRALIASHPNPHDALALWQAAETQRSLAVAANPSLAENAVHTAAAHAARMHWGELFRSRCG